MIHIIRQIERRSGHRPGEGRTATRALLLSAAALLLGLGILLSPRARAEDFDAVRASNEVLDAMDAGDFAAVHARFDATMAGAITVEQLAQGWKVLPAQIGALKERGEARVVERDGRTLVTIPLQYEKAALNAMLAFDAEHRLGGFAIRPAAPAAAPAAPPVPADAHYRELELRIGDEATGLAATLALPNGDGPFPAVVLVHGSGPHDRDETIGPNRPFLDIARGLAQRGVAVLRYEKRTKARPQDFADGGSIDLETTDDAVLAAALLRSQTGIDPKRVFVLGHSLGGMMAPRIGARDPQIAGLVLLAAPSRPLLDILIEQNRRMAILNDGKTSDAESIAIQQLTDSVAAVRGGREIAAAQAPMGIAPAYWRSVDAVDQVAEARAIEQPLLFLQGARDIQVVDADWQGWRDAFHDSPRASFKLYETLNHLAISGEGDGNLQEYQTPGHVDAALIADIAAWIAAQPTK
ncbi:MAG: alpha/beta fold hydrolase [Xanthomonadales bacterium]|nr:alpha/beta fold hydrolase [Xanthomonadales bacterium]